jgi:hypothetical protein
LYTGSTVTSIFFFIRAPVWCFYFISKYTLTSTMVPSGLRRGEWLSSLCLRYSLWTHCNVYASYFLLVFLPFQPYSFFTSSSPAPGNYINGTRNQPFPLWRHHFWSSYISNIFLKSNALTSTLEWFGFLLKQLIS